MWGESNRIGRQLTPCTRVGTCCPRGESAQRLASQTDRPGPAKGSQASFNEFIIPAKKQSSCRCSDSEAWIFSKNPRDNLPRLGQGSGPSPRRRLYDPIVLLTSPAYASAAGIGTLHARPCTCPRTPHPVAARGVRYAAGVRHRHREGERVRTDPAGSTSQCDQDPPPGTPCNPCARSGGRSLCPADVSRRGEARASRRAGS